MRHSGLQKRVLTLYRHFLRLARTKPSLQTSVRDEFRKYANVDVKNVSYVEYLVSRGQRQLNMLRMSSVKSVTFLKSQSESNDPKTTLENDTSVYEKK